MSFLKVVLYFLFGFCAVLSARSQTTSLLTVTNSYPYDGATNVHPFTNIGLNFSEALDPHLLCLDSIIVSGSHHNKYAGTLKLSNDRKTLIFIPAEHFLLGDTIHAHIGSFTSSEGKVSNPFFLHFITRTAIATSSVIPGSNETVSIPLLPADVPQMSVLVNNNPSDGQIYITGSIQNYRIIAILDKNGNGEKIIQQPQPFMNADFKPNTNGSYSYFDGAHKCYLILDTNLTQIDSVVAPIQYSTDFHEIRFTSDDDRILIGLDTQVLDMSQYIPGGDSTAVVFVPTILKLDKRNNLIWEWKSLDHFKVTDATHENLKFSRVDFCHMNAIEFDTDSNLLISSRNMDEITKIDRTTGNIIWRWGGNNNQFHLIGDTNWFSHQHAIRRTSAGTYMMFDNGDFRVNQLGAIVPPFSRAVEYRLDEDSRTAEKIWEFRHNPDIASEGMGYAERLSNKSTFIDWGNYLGLAITEVDSTSNTRFEMSMPTGSYSYRAYKYDSNYVRIGLKAGVRSTPASTMIISVMPNPVTAFAKVECNLPSYGFADIALYDVLGREVSKVYSGFLSEGSHEFTINSGNLSVGLYYVRANLNGVGSASQQIVVMK